MPSDMGGPVEDDEPSPRVLRLAAALGEMKVKDRHVLIRRFGLDGRGERSLAEVSGRMKLTRQAVSIRQAAALARLRPLMEDVDL